MKQHLPCLISIFILGLFINSNLIYAQKEIAGIEQNQSHKAFIKPPYLKQGDTVAIVTPAGFLKDSTAVEKGMALMRSWGLKVVIGEHIYDKHNRFAGKDADRASDLQWAMDTPSIKAIWCARGGYGTVRVLDYLDYSNFMKQPKWIIGYSDITVLHNVMHTKGIETVHGIMASSDSSFEKSHVVSSLYKALFGKKISYKIPATVQNRKGSASGQLVGGNLSLVASLLGTPFDLNTKNKIIFLEDIGEYLYRLDRMLMSLKLNGYFNHCNGLIIGGFNNIPKNEPGFGMSIEEIVNDIVGEADFPILFNFPSGHFPENLTLPLGRMVSMKVGKRRSKIVFEK